ncbi:MAG: CBS domain-containing protein [Gammaproteobacteria bacterium]|nr:CBS domain-containing protein [Gammaproteobacteria bacterium]MCB1862203.1 CBS domain-containing protein [Gammaproteobacteria bacterium]MCB1872151.1 CBS domain-containing protein [Gammaproteobacteria bacterium]MCB1879516.1 CBS domain-containing protein [Gammaproteobacteria bacterium]MCB1903290.1 CBS domain-containing protein [Gammaproteobacteria bacterium]
MSKKDAKNDSAFYRWVKSVSHRFSSAPENRAQLIELLREAKKHHLLDGEALSMIEGVLQVSELRVRDIMIPRAHMVVIDRNDAIEKFLPLVIESAHSRFPVIDDNRGQVVGIILAKDLLAYSGKKGRKRFDIRDVLRSAVFVPESKRLNVLLNEFRASRNHMAIVVDEYGAAAGLVTIEDVLEQIVGEIEDEHDFDEEAAILKRGDQEFTAKAYTTIKEFNDYFHANLPDHEFDTLSGLVAHALGHLPQRGESAEIGSFKFKVLRADSRRIHLLSIRQKKEDAVDGA